MTTDKSHSHQWVPDGESWTESEHHDSCKVPDKKGIDKLNEKVDNCECERVRYRRYTCHCGKMKEVKYTEE